MGMDLIAIGEHNIKANSIIELTELVPQKIRVDFKSELIKNHVKSTCIYDNDLWFDNQWKIEFDDHCFTDLEEQLNSDNEITFKGPYNINIYVGINSISISPPIRWALFLKNEQIQKDFRAMTKQLIESIAGERAIYTADNGTKSSMYDQYVAMGKTLDEILELMELEVGQPTKELSDIISLTSDKSMYDGYYIDEFKINNK